MRSKRNRNNTNHKVVEHNDQMSTYAQISYQIESITKAIEKTKITSALNPFGILYYNVRCNYSRTLIAYFQNSEYLNPERIILLNNSA